MKYALLLLLLSFGISAAQQPVPLRDGQRVVLHGTLTMEPAGRLQFVTVKTTGSYLPIFHEGGGKESSGETLQEIGLAGYADYARLYAHRGQQVTVTGKMSTDDATPYFWHGTRLQATGIRSADGVDLRGKAGATWIAVDTGLYRAEVMLPADLAAPWRYSFEGKTVGEGTYLSCGSNGGGDVVNCFCAQGFHPMETRSSVGGRPWQGEVLNDMHMAQFRVGDDARAAELSVTCSR